jgi:hypothetical protein
MILILLACIVTGTIIGAPVARIIASWIGA